MPLPHPDPLAELKHRLISGDEWIWLFEFTSPTGGPLLTPEGDEVVPRFTPRTVPVTYGTLSTGKPRVFSPWPARLHEIASDSKGNVNEIRLTIGNILSVVTRLLKANDWLRNHKVVVRLTHASLLDQAAADAEWRATVVESTVSWESATLVLSAFAFMDFAVPQQLITPSCRRRYRGPGCAFVGDADNAELGDCALTIEACRQRGQWELDNGLPVIHPTNFGGYLGTAKGPVAAPKA